jgi:hypothetical protein
VYQGYGTHYVNLWVGAPTPQRHFMINNTGSNYDLIADGGDDNNSGCGDQAHKENIESKHFKIYLSNFSC